MVYNGIQHCVIRHGILHKPSASVKFWPKCFRKSSVIFGVLCITNYAWFSTFLAWQTLQFLTLWTEFKIQLQTIFKLLQLYMYLYSPCTLWNIKYFTSSFADNLKPFFLHCNFHNVENSNCTFHILEYIAK